MLIEDSHCWSFISNYHYRRQHSVWWGSTALLHHPSTGQWTASSSNPLWEYLGIIIWSPGVLIQKSWGSNTFHTHPELCLYSNFSLHCLAVGCPYPKLNTDPLERIFISEESPIGPSSYQGWELRNLSSHWGRLLLVLCAKRDSAGWWADGSLITTWLLIVWPTSLSSTCEFSQPSPSYLTLVAWYRTKCPWLLVCLQGIQVYAHDIHQRNSIHCTY